MDLIGAVESGDIVRVRELLDSGEDPNLQNDYDTALMEASYYGNTENVGLLLENDADPNIQCHSGETSLIMASSRGYINIVKMLLDNGADPNIHMLNGETASMISKRRGHNDVARLIRDHIGLQKARQRLAFATFLLGDDTHMDDLDYDVTSRIADYLHDLDQYGSGSKRSSRRSSSSRRRRKRKNYARRRRFF